MRECSESVSSGSLAFLSDGAIALAAQRGSHAAMEHLLAKYRPVVATRAHDYFWAGADADDVVQEGMIGLYKAIRDYSAAAKTGFRSFAELCIHRQIISALKAANRRKHMLLSGCLSTAQPLGNDEGLTVLGEVLADSHAAIPERVVIGRDIWEAIRQFAFRGLSQLEWHALLEHIGGERYQDIAAELGCNAKQIDNALQRAKRKIAGQFVTETTS